MIILNIKNNDELKLAVKFLKATAWSDGDTLDKDAVPSGKFPIYLQLFSRKKLICYGQMNGFTTSVIRDSYKKVLDISDLNL